MAQGRTYKDVVDYFKHFPIDNSGQLSDENSWNDRIILDHFLDSRVAYFQNLIRHGKPVGEQSIQTLPCVELEEADKSECPCAPPSGCVWLRTKEILPKWVRLLSVTDILGNVKYNRKAWTRFKYTLNSRIKSVREAKYYTIRSTDEGHRIYILNDIHKQIISISAIFEDPYCVAIFKNCGKQDKDKVCNPWDTPFLAERHVLDAIMKIAWQILPSVRSFAGSDIFNDTLDNTKGVINPNI